LEAKDGLDALEVSGRYTGKIHLLLSDMVMPKMSGTQLAERLTAVRRDMKVLFMSGYSEYVGGSNQPSVQTPILQKPFSISSFVEKIREVLAGSPAEQPSDANVRMA